MDQRRLLGVLCGMGAGALWGLVFLAPKVIPEGAPVIMAVGRYLAYGLIALALLAPMWRRVSSRLDAAAWRGLVTLSLFGNIIYYCLLVVAVHYAGVAASALIVGMVPVVVTIWGLKDPGAAPLRKLAPPLLLAVVAVGLIGLEAIRMPASDESAAINGLIGLACALAALISWSAYAVQNSRWLDRVSGVTAHQWSLLTGVTTGALALALIPVALLVPGQAPSPDFPWERFVAVSAGVAVAASIIANALWNQASRLMPLTMLGQMIVFETLFGLFYGFLYEQRWPTGLEVLAVALMVVSVVWCVRAHAPSAAPVAEGDR